MITICKLKLDGRGRLAFPSSFLKANGIKKDSCVTVHPVGGRGDAVRLEFEWEDINDAL